MCSWSVRPCNEDHRKTSAIYVLLRYLSIYRNCNSYVSKICIELSLAVGADCPDAREMHLKLPLWFYNYSNTMPMLLPIVKFSHNIREAFETEKNFFALFKIHYCLIEASTQRNLRQVKLWHTCMKHKIQRLSRQSEKGSKNIFSAIEAQCINSHVNKYNWLCASHLLCQLCAVLFLICRLRFHDFVRLRLSRRPNNFKPCWTVSTRHQINWNIAPAVFVSSIFSLLYPMSVVFFRQYKYLISSWWCFTMSKNSFSLTFSTYNHVRLFHFSVW